MALLFNIKNDHYFAVSQIRLRNFKYLLNILNRRILSFYYAILS